MNGRFFVTMQKLDGVFNGQYVIRLVLIHLVENGSQGGGFSRTGRASHQHNPIAKFDDLLQRRGQSQIRKTGNIVGNDAHYDRAGSALPEDVYAEAADTINSVRQIR